MELNSDYVRSGLTWIIQSFTLIAALTAGYTMGFWWGVCIFVSGGIAIILIGDPIGEQNKKLAAYYMQTDAKEPWSGVEFRVSSNPACYSDVRLTNDQALHCAYKLAQELSIDFMGLKVHITDQQTHSDVPRRMVRQGASYEFQMRKKLPHERLDPEEQRFMPRFEQIKARCSADAADGMVMADAIEPYIPNEPMNGARGDQGVYHNERFYLRGSFVRRRGWDGSRVWVTPAARRRPGVNTIE